MNISENIRSIMPNKFECQGCGCEELAYSSYAKCLIPIVTREDQRIEYLEAVVNSDDTIQNTGHYCCSECGSPVGNHLRTEQDLLEYLSGEIVKQDEI